MTFIVHFTVRLSIVLLMLPFSLSGALFKALVEDASFLSGSVHAEHKTIMQVEQALFQKKIGATDFQLAVLNLLGVAFSCCSSAVFFYLLIKEWM